MRNTCDSDCRAAMVALRLCSRQNCRMRRMTSCESTSTDDMAAEQDERRKQTEQRDVADSFLKAAGLKTSSQREDAHGDRGR
jgi:hypothetical protein